MNERDLPELAELPPLDPDALGLLRGGSELSQVRDDGRARLSARVMSSIAAVPGGGGPGDSGPGTPAPAPASAAPAATTAVRSGSALGTSAFIGMGLTFVLGAALGFGVRPLLSADENVQTARIASPAIPEVHSAPRTLGPALPPAPVESVSTAPSAAPGAKAGPLRDLSAERAMLDGARAALGRGDPAAAVVAAKAHEQRFPRGALAEEREALYVQALAQSGKMPEARARAARFKQNYPDSMLLPAVSAAIESPSPKEAP